MLKGKQRLADEDHFIFQTRLFSRKKMRHCLQDGGSMAASNTTDNRSTAASRITFKDIMKSLTQKNMLIALLMGFASGVPFLLISRTLQAWLSYTGATNVLVGVAAAISLPYTIKFLWSPFLDRYELPFLGRRRGWILLSQILLLVTIAAMSQIDPMSNLLVLFSFAFFIAFFSATQDIVVDAFRRESLKDEELGMASSVYQMGYRFAMWVTGGLALILAGSLSWNTTYLIMASMMLVGIVTTLWADEPQDEGVTKPKTMQEAVFLPLKDFFSRKGVLLILLFVLLYKAGDAMAGNMLIKLYKDLGFTPEEVGVIAKTMGPISVMAGTFVGGILIMKLGIYRSLLIFGVFQSLSTLSFVFLNMSGHNLPVLTGVVFFEDFSGGMGSAAFLAFLASLTNRSFTATQYALLSSLTAVPRTFISSSTGYLVDGMGWNGFFIFCALFAIPGLLLLTYINRKEQKESEPEISHGSSSALRTPV